MKTALSFALATLLLAACSQPHDGSDVKAPPLTKDEAKEDLDVLVASVRRLYGPLEYKERRFGWKLDEIVKEARERLAASTSEADTIGALVRFLGRLEDGHVSINVTNKVDGVNYYRLGLFTVPLEGKAIVALADAVPTSLGVAIGDELVSIDGKAPHELLPLLKQYAWLGNDVSDEHLIYLATSRPFYVKELVPKAPTAKLVLKRPTGATYTIEVAWKKDKSPLAQTDFVAKAADVTMKVAGAAAYSREAKGSLADFGAWRPFFATPQVEAQFGLVRVKADAEHLAKFGVTMPAGTPGVAFAASGNGVPGEDGPFYAAKYQYKGKRVLLIRQATYAPDVPPELMLAHYRALLDQYQAETDVLVIDQTHNPGGSLDYAADFFRMFVKKDAEARNLVQHMNVDRRWIDMLSAWAQELQATKPADAEMALLRAKAIDQALDQGLSITAPMPLVGGNHLAADPRMSWEKPILFLANELSGSCGDIVPMLMQRNGRAKIFGERTMGLGGNVEDIATLPNSQASVSLTRGLFTTYNESETYTEAELVENNGIKPDVPHELTVADFRAGFVDYVQHVSEAAVAQLAQ